MIYSLQHFGLTVPDLEVGRQFYTCFGMNTEERGSDLVFRCESRDQDQVRLIEGARKKLSYISLGTDLAGMGGLKLRLEKMGVKLHDDPFRTELGGIWFMDPVGDWVHVQVAEPAVSSAVLPLEVNSPGRIRRINVRACDLDTVHTKARPRRLGHLIKFTPDVNKSVDFYTRALGLKLTDRAGDILAFLTGAKGGDHHILAFAKSSHSGLHHASFEVGSVDELELGAQTLIKAGYQDCFGLGRHVAGSNFFHYIRDPWGSLAEYFWDIDHVSEDALAEGGQWEIIDASPEDVTAVWAKNPPPEDFVLNFEARD